MKTYTLEELEATHKTGLDYVEDHKRLLKSLKEQHPQNADDPQGLWELPNSGNSFWQTGNIMNEDGTKMEGSGRVPKAKADE
jgi:hypothetical protein